MIYGFSLLFVLLGLVLCIPAARKLLRMREINRNNAVTTGLVTSASSALGWLWTSGFGSSTRPLIKYQSPKGIDIILEVADSSMFTFRKDEPGMAVEVVFDVTVPGRAYAKPDWRSVLQDLWLGLGALFLAAVLWIGGLLLKAPF